MNWRVVQQHRKDDNQKELVAVMLRLGIMVWDTGKPVDLLCGLAGEFFTVEIKNPKGRNRERPGQVQFRLDCKAMNLPHYVIRTQDDVIKMHKERNHEAHISGF